MIFHSLYARSSSHHADRLGCTETGRARIGEVVLRPARCVEMNMDDWVEPDVLDERKLTEHR